jgi:hypothetical protein
MIHQLKASLSLRTIQAAYLGFLAVVGLVALAQPAPAQAAGRFYLSPSGGTYNVGDIIRVTLFVDTGGQAINAEKAAMSWSGPIQYSSYSTAGTINDYWPSGPNASATGLNFEGGMPGSKAYNGGAGRILQVIFTAKDVGTATVSVNGLEIFTNSDPPQNILCCSSGATFTIVRPKPPVPLLQVESKTHPDSGRWYNSRHIQVNWYATVANNGYAWSFDRNPRTEPPGALSGVQSASHDASDDGTWYFHLRSANETGGNTLHFQINIDTQPPGEFAVKVDNGGNASNPTPKATFEASDGAAGIERYEASIDGGAPFPIASGDPLPRQRPGEHTLVIRAIDKAGNVRESKTTYKIDGIAAPKIVTWDEWVVIQQPIRFLGQSEPGDTIIVFLGDKEVDRFLARDKQVPKDYNKGELPKDNGGFTDGITWEYEYKTELFPGKYQFRFARTNAAGAESSLTPIHETEVKAVVIKLMGRPFSPKFIIRLLLIIIALLLVVIGYLLGRVHWGKPGKGAEGSPGPIKRLKRLPRSFVVLLKSKRSKKDADDDSTDEEGPI